MADNDYIIQTLGRMEERQIRNSEGISAINAHILNILQDNVECNGERADQDDRLVGIESTQKIQKAFLAAGFAAIPVFSFAMDWFKK